MLRKAGCPACHNHDGVASGTRVLFPETDASDAELDRFGLSLQAVVDRSAPEKSLLLLKPTKRIPHAGGLRIKPAVPRRVSSRVGRISRKDPTCSPTSQGGRSRSEAKARLTETYPFAIQQNDCDLLGNDSRLADQFPPEDFVNGFKNQFQSQSISPLLAESYSIAAEASAWYAFLVVILQTHSLQARWRGRPSLHGVFH